MRASFPSRTLHAEADPVVARLGELDPDELTPRQALELLARLVEEVKARRE